MTILAYPDLLLEGGKCLSGQPTVLCFPAQKCPLCDGRLTASAQRGQNNITLLTTTGPKEAQLVGWGLLAAACAINEDIYRTTFRSSRNDNVFKGCGMTARQPENNYFRGCGKVRGSKNKYFRETEGLTRGLLALGKCADVITATTVRIASLEIEWKSGSNTFLVIGPETIK
eukprot:299861-Pelagomonas_calceolata.AAC.1